jgi:hypothetical protein
VCSSVEGGTRSLTNLPGSDAGQPPPPEPWEEVVDPGGGETEVFVTCAREIDDLVAELAPRLGWGGLTGIGPRQVG